MAIQTGIISYSGKLGNTIGYARGKKNFNRALAQPYQLTEESIKSGVEFGRGSAACALTKLALAPLLLYAFKNSLHNRLAAIYRNIIRSGPVAEKGKRNVFDGNIGLLTGFELNAKRQFGSLLRFSSTTDLINRQVKLALGAMHWQDVLRKPRGANAAVMQVGFAFLDFKDNNYQFKLAPALRITEEKAFSGGSLTVDLPEIKEHALLVVAHLFFESLTGNDVYQISQQLYQAGICLTSMHILDGEMVVFKEETLPEQAFVEERPPDLIWDLKSED